MRNIRMVILGKDVEEIDEFYHLSLFYRKDATNLERRILDEIESLGFHVWWRKEYFVNMGVNKDGKPVIFKEFSTMAQCDKTYKTILLCYDAIKEASESYDRNNKRLSDPRISIILLHELAHIYDNTKYRKEEILKNEWNEKLKNKEEIDYKQYENRFSEVHREFHGNIFRKIYWELLEKYNQKDRGFFKYVKLNTCSICEKENSGRFCSTCGKEFEGEK